jgi:ubiquinone/menaquinone biosynthesis C-methylase UbiE
MELARLSGGEVVGIDIDETALSDFRARLARQSPEPSIRVAKASFLETGFSDESFDILWAEGVLHMLDPAKSLAECHRLLRPGGFLVLHETVSWYEGVQHAMTAAGLHPWQQHLLPQGCWWTDYGAPLEERIRAFREANPASADDPALAEYESQVAVIKADPQKQDSGFYIQRKG